MADIELENTGRSVLIFPVEVAGKAGKRPKIVRTVVIGDSADRVPYAGGERDHKLQPDPLVRLTLDEYLEAFAAGSSNRRVLVHYISTGVVRCTKGAELISG